MMNLTKTVRILTLSFLLGVLSLTAYAERNTVDGVTIEYEVQADGSAFLIKATNESASKVRIKIDGKTVTTLLPGNKKPQGGDINQTAHRRISFDYTGSNGATLWRVKVSSKPKVEETSKIKPAENNETVKSPKESVKSPKSEKTEKREPAEKIEKVADNPVPSTAPAPAPAPAGADYPLVLDRLNKDSFFGKDAVSNYTQTADSYTKALSLSDDKPQFLIDNDIEKFIQNSEEELKQKKVEIPLLARDLVASANIEPTSQSTILSYVIDILNSRYNQRETSFNKLQTEVNSIPTGSPDKPSRKGSFINYLIVGILVIVLLAWILLTIRKRKNKAATKKQPVQAQARQDSEPDGQAIVVRKKTSSILKKQSLEDVINNPEYLLINSSEFTPDSAIRNIYIKNTCIKEVYNMYAEDLRNTNNPKEDGCMVLGRWVHNEDSNTYDISLETVVYPGDDAVFKEYELNFGGKIKLRIAEKLRKLRRETNLQYDLVCWIHSHPGLGVFFSNSDDNVQMQLKHSQHPYFLIAFVVDILTSDQEMGIFTFRRDGTMNSKTDLTKMYSLEDMYKWALESDKASFNPENYHNLLASAKMHIPTCKGIELNNSSVIDLTQIVIEPATGIVGWAVGTDVEADGDREFAVSGIVKTDGKPSAGVIGVLLNVPHMSLPTIQRLITNENTNLSFVLVYSSKQNTLTSIPVVNGELLTNELFYGEETIDDLKIWTRRKR